jgi:hypothetical protein
MKRILLFFVVALFSLTAEAQILPNISYNAQLNATCASANTACANAVFVTGYGSTGTPGSFGSGAAIDIPVANYNAATITVSGTYAGSTINFEFSDPTSGTNYFQEVCARTDINLLEVSEVLPTNQVRAWNCPVWAATRFRVRQSAYTSGNANVWITLTQAAIDPSLVVAASIANVAGANDPCQDLSAIKSGAVVNITGTTAVELVAAVAAKSVYVCSGSLTIQGSATTVGTVQFETGTKVTNPCDTSLSVRTGAFAGNINPSVPTPIEIPSGMTQFTSVSGGEICAVSTGTTISIQGYISYVQQ